MSVCRVILIGTSILIEMCMPHFYVFFVVDRFQIGPILIFLKCYLFEKVAEKEGGEAGGRESKSELLSTYLLFKWLQKSGLVWPEARNLELHSCPP